MTSRLPVFSWNISKKGGYLVLSLLFQFCVSNANAQKRLLKVTHVATDSLDVQLQFYTPGIVRIIKTPGTSKSIDHLHLYLVASPEPVRVEESVRNGAVVFKTDSLTIQVSKHTGSITFLERGNTLLSEDPLVGPLFESLPGKEKSFRLKQGFKLDKSEAIYGLGQHQKGMMNQRDQELVLQQTNKEIAIPMFFSIKGYGVLWNNESTTLFSDTLGHTFFLSDKGRVIDYFFMEGKRSDDVVAGMRYLTGSAPMPPKWAFGYFQSRERYESRHQILDVVKKYRRLQVPLDCIVQDWRYWGMDMKDWNATKFGNPAFPDPKTMIDSVHLLNAHMIISVWPSFGENTEVYKQLNKDSLLLYHMKTWPEEGGVAIYDAFNPKARDIVWDNMHKNLFSKGMDGWWLDATEPIDKSINAYKDILEHNRDTVPTVLNSYPLYTTSGIARHQKQTSNSKRVFILTRSAFTGQQHYGTFAWSGDITSSWDVMKDQVSGGLNLAICGLPFWNTDIGGFFSGTLYPKGVSDPAYKELYVRWLEMGTFFPLMRSHGTSTPREIYQFGEKGSWAYDAIDKFIRFRYRLLPYNYATAFQTYKHNASFMRPLFAEFNKDPKTYNINDEYLYGSSLLIAPVFESQYINATDKPDHAADFTTVKSRKLYLPDSTAWFDFYTGKKMDGGRWIQKQTPIDIMPVYVKAGSIVPLGEVQQYVGEKDGHTLEIRVYPGANGTFTLYEDEGDNYNYETGHYTTIDFSWDNKNQQLRIGDIKGAYKGSSKSYTFKIVRVDEKSGIGMEPSGKYNNIIHYSGSALKVNLN